MNKFYGLATFLIFSLNVNSQVLETDNFDTLNLEHIEGQQGWSRDGGGIDEANVVVLTADKGQSLEFVRTGMTESMWIYKPSGLQNPWMDRDENNNVFVTEFDFFTGDNTLGTAESGLQLYSESYNYIAGVYFDFSTKTFVGSTYPTGVEEVTYYNLGGEVFQNNEWVKVRMFYVVETGKVIWQFNNSTSSFEVDTDAELNPVEVDFFSFGPKISAIDNYASKAVVSPTMTTTESGVTAIFNIKVYPNPTTDFVNITASENINKIQFFDASGREVLAKKANGKIEKVDVSNFANGIYIVKATLDNGKMHTQKIIKQ